MQVTEKWLSEIGGWQAMKSAREYVRQGAVVETSQEGSVYKGLVGQGARRFSAVLTVKDSRNVDCRCACSEARRGLICAHGLAVALIAVTGGAAKAGPPPALPSRSAGGYKATTTPPASATEARKSALGLHAPGGNIRTAPAAPPLDLETVPVGKFTVSISTTHLGQGPQSTVPVFLEFAPGGETKEVELAGWLHERGLKHQTMPLRLPLTDLAEIFTALKGHPRVLEGLPQRASKPAANSLNASKSLIINDLHLKSEMLRVKLAENATFQLVTELLTVINVNSQRWIRDPECGAIMVAPAGSVNNLRAFFDELFTTKTVERSLRWVAANLGALGEILDIESPGSPLSEVRVVPADPVLGLHLDGNLKRLEAVLTVKPAPGIAHPVTLGADLNREWRETDLYPVADPSGAPGRFRHRNLHREHGAWQRLESAGFRLDPQGALAIQGENDVLHFLAGELPRLRNLFEVTESDAWRRATKDLATVRPQMRARPGEETGAGAGSGSGSPPSGMDWLSLEVAYEAADGYRIPRQEVLRLIRSGKRDVRAANGRRYLLDIEGCEELEETLQDVESRFGQGGQSIQIRSRQLEVLGEFLGKEITLPKVCPVLPEADIRLLLSDLGNQLRPYQLEGVQWLERHARAGGGGLLADEMGLGKTVQTLATLRIILGRIKREKVKKGADAKGPALVICPTSLLTNWSEEAAKFTPELKTHISHDIGRKEMLGKLTEFDVIFTSYALIIRDLEYYVDIKFSVIVLDEASYIRNPDTASAKALCQLRADCRIALTGTPVENSVKDLWSIFSFLMPRYLPILEDFQSRFVKPLSQGDGKQARAVMERLQRLIRPYLFRRTKREVAKDLPEKIEKVVWCELTREQKEVYQRLLDEGREEIRSARKRSGQGSARMTMFTVLLRLRQVCNDLRLLKMDGVTPKVPGGKWPMLEELLTEIVESGGKALIFSQFVGMLKLVRTKVTDMDVPHSYLDGSTQDRGAQVAAFQTDALKKFFLISLKAGGYGLNLTAADHVLLVDPWWNPAVEAQAIDRAHRIGQGKPVTAYRLATRGTVEEKILKLQEKKRSIMDMTLEDDPAVMAGVTDDELEEMLNG